MLQTSLTHGFESNPKMFENFRLEIPGGELVCILGPNGIGKSTLLNLVAGIQKPEKGGVWLNNKLTSETRVGYAAQDYRNSLFPWLSIQDNIAFPLILKGTPIRAARLEAKKLCQELEVNLDLKAYPYELSGGQQQLASILRGLIIRPSIYLLDEPFSSLDYQTTIQMLELFAKMWEKNKITTLFVSHEIDEAVFLATTIIILRGSPVRVVDQFQNHLPYPRTRQIMNRADFIRLKNQIINIINL